MRREDIFKQLFKVIVPKIATYSEDELKHVGMRIDGYFDKEGFIVSDSNKLNLALDTKVMISIDKMIDIYANGYPIKVPNQEDVIKIGEMLDKYLENNFEDYSIHTRHKIDSRNDIIKEFMNEILGLNLKVFEKHENEKLNSFGFDNLNLMNTMTGEIGNHRPKIELSLDKPNDEMSYRPSYTIKE